MYLGSGREKSDTGGKLYIKVRNPVETIEVIIPNAMRRSPIFGRL